MTDKQFNREKSPSRKAATVSVEQSRQSEPTAGSPPPLTAASSGGGSPSRRWLIAAGAVLALGIAGTQLFGSNPPSLPLPAAQEAGPEYLAATLAFKPAPTREMPPDHSAWKTCSPTAGDRSMASFDLVLAIDTTGSMGRVIADVKNNVYQLITTLQAGGGSVRVGIVAYRDVGDTYLVQQFPLVDLDAVGAAYLQQVVASLGASGGGDWPEAVDQAIFAATSMNWRGNVPASIVVIGDAPVHPANEAAAFGAAQDFSGRIKGAQISVIDSGSGAHAFMRALPAHGGGQYVTYDGSILKSLFPSITGCDSR